MEKVKNEEFDNIKFTAKQKKYLISRLLKYLKPYKLKLFFILILQFFLGAVEAFPPVMIGIVFDQIAKATVHNDFIRTIRFYEITNFFDRQILTIYGVLIGYFIITIISGIITYKKTVFLQKVGNEIILNIRKDLFSHIQTLDLAQVNNIPVGTLVTRVVYNTQSLIIFFGELIVSLIYLFSLFLIYFIYLFTVQYVMALYMVLYVIAIFITSFIFRIFARKVYRDNKQKESEMNAFLSENISGIKIIQIFNQEKNKQKEFEFISYNYKKSMQKAVLVHAIFRPLIYFISKLGQALICYLAIKYVLEGKITYGLAFSFIQISASFFFPIQGLTDQFDQLQVALAAAEKIFNIFDLKPNVVDNSNTKDLINFKGKIEFKNVYFAYKDDNYILKDLSFTVNPNETMAIVGPTGSGKTTILNLIVKNYKIQKGQILLDDIDIENLTASSIRKQIGQMLQDSFLFNGTIKDNLTFGDYNIKDEEINMALEYVGASHIVNKQTNKLNQIVYERGQNFSQGERQLLSFARNILYKPSVMFLDEATANIDTETEQKIQNSLNKLMKVNTMIVVAHRLSTIKNATNILVLKDGVKEEFGSHDKLLNKKGFYYKLYKVQFESDKK